MQLHVGDRATLSKAVTSEDVADFARLTLDSNPLHLDDDYARGTRFGGRIAHGMLGASLISAVIGTKLGGPIYLDQSLHFLKPVRIGDTLTATAQVVAVRTDRNIFTLETTVTNQDGTRVITGEATVLAL